MPPMRRILPALLLALTLSLFPQLGIAEADPQPTLPLPPRPAGAMEGTAFYQLIKDLPESEREQHIIDQVAAGNVPGFLRALKPITVSGDGEETSHTLTFFAAPDYLAVGSDEDFFRIPMSAPMAQQVANITDCQLPTRKMVDAIWEAAAVKLAPHPFHPSEYEIDTVEVFWLSNQAIEEARQGEPLGQIVAGIKKDIVVTPQIDERPSPPRVAIYGWHYQNGDPIQPLSLVHSASYEDYSHGVRLIDRTCLVNGEEMEITQVLADPALAPLISDEGDFTTTSYPVPEPYPLPDEERPRKGGWKMD